MPLAHERSVARTGESEGSKRCFVYDSGSEILVMKRWGAVCLDEEEGRRRLVCMLGVYDV